ncbi:hypothetical protein [Streptomyces sp. NPDC088736]
MIGLAIWAGISLIAGLLWIAACKIARRNTHATRTDSRKETP